MYVKESPTWKCKKESPESHSSSGSSTAATLTATVSDDIVHDGDDGNDDYDDDDEKVKMMMAILMIVMNKNLIVISIPLNIGHRGLTPVLVGLHKLCLLFLLMIITIVMVA